MSYIFLIYFMHLKIYNCVCISIFSIVQLNIIFIIFFELAKIMYAAYSFFISIITIDITFAQCNDSKLFFIFFNIIFWKTWIIYVRSWIQWQEILIILVGKSLHVLIISAGNWFGFQTICKIFVYCNLKNTLSWIKFGQK